MIPDSKKHHPSPKYLRSLMDGANISQRKTAQIIGISERSIRQYLAGDRPIPYTVQFAIECLCNPNNHPPLPENIRTI